MAKSKQINVENKWTDFIFYFTVSVLAGFGYLVLIGLFIDFIGLPFYKIVVTFMLLISFFLSNLIFGILLANHILRWKK